MRQLATILFSIFVLGVWPAAGLRADTALILSNERYDAAPQMRSARVITRLQEDLSAAGFDVIVVRNGTSAEMRGGLSRLLSADETQRVVIVAAGHYLRGARDSWLLGVEARVTDLAGVGGVGVPVSVMADIAASAPGRAVLLLATDDIALRTGAGLETGIGRVEAPQGVTVVAGGPAAVADFVSGPLLAPGTDIPAVLEAIPGLQATGFLSPSVSFMPQTVMAPAPDTANDEEAFWRAMEDMGTAAAYRAYLDRYPDGAYAALARARLAFAQPSNPQDAAEAREAALGLTRDDRRQVQRFLTILGFDTRGVDGIFGAASRRAIAAWQEARGYARTGYLDEAQLATLRNEGEIRDAVLAEERRAQEREDRAWWRATGAGDTPQGLRAYLERYPDGIYAERARAALGEAEEAVAETAWNRARAIDTASAYRDFIREFPDSRRAAAAEARLLELETGIDEADRATYEAREAALNLAPISRLLVEQRLARLGHDPGRIDGTFDAATRQAIRGFQDVRGMVPTGYLDQSMIAVLLAGSLGEILR